MAYRHYTCSFCGKQVNEDVFHTTLGLANLMRSEQLCYDCAYWINYAKYPLPNTEVISGSLYRFTQPLVPATDARLPQIHGARLIEIATGQIWAMRGFVFRGEIPPAFRPYIPNRYCFIDRESYLRIRGYQAEKCKRKGCFDRYHCFWYDEKEMEPNGPWNKVPADWKVGGEKCPSFINKNTLYDYSDIKQPLRPHR